MTTLTHRIATFFLVSSLGFGAGALTALVNPESDAVIAERTFRHPDLDIPSAARQLGELSPAAAAEARQALSILGVPADLARVDQHSGRFITLLPTTPLVPGDGVGNSLTWSDLGVKAVASREAREAVAWNAFHDYLTTHQNELGIDPKELGQHRIVSHDDGDIYQFYVTRTFDGIPVRSSQITATIGHGNLILFSTERWGDRGRVSRVNPLSVDEAMVAAENYLHPARVAGQWATPSQVYLTMADGVLDHQAGGGYRYVLAWSLHLTVDGDGGSWEVLVDAHTGEILANQDQNHYVEAKGGVYPVTNDGIPPGGVDQPGWPMPFMNVGSAVTDTGGNFQLTGNQTAAFDGPFVNMDDQCGTDSLTQSGGIYWGTSGGTDCTTPGFGGAGNTHASRSGFYGLNRIKEWARGWLPGNSWLQTRLTSNVNINGTCNAFWNGSTLNFYRSGGGCSNTGEIASIFDHEWGHGMDANDVTGGIASPSGEGIADIYTALHLNDSCIGHNFQPGVQCSGHGDPCLDCTGVRDIDYLQRQSGQPHDYSWSNANCGGSVHCTGNVYAEAVWSLWKRKLQSAPYDYDDNTAHEIVNRLTFIAAGNTTTWFSGGPPFGGCAGSGGYLNYLAADDDNGNLNDGTPHMTAIFAAFDDQEIACQTPVVQDGGCAGTPTTAPDVTALPGNNSVSLSWEPVVDASSYQVFRTEGVFGCSFGKVKVAEITTTSFTDTGLQKGRDYSYVVIPKGPADSCYGPASACDTAIPTETSHCDGRTIIPGLDYWSTPVDGAEIRLDIPMGFFCSGSAAITPEDPAHRLQGRPLLTSPPRAIGTTDTIVERLTDATFVDGVAETEIAIRALSLESVEPLTVSCGSETEEWKVKVSLDGLQQHGTIAIRCNPVEGDPVEYGGTFDAELEVTAKIELEKVGAPGGESFGPLPDPDAPQEIRTVGIAEWSSVLGPNGVDFSGSLTVDSDGDGDIDASDFSSVVGSDGNFFPGWRAGTVTVKVPVVHSCHTKMLPPDPLDPICQTDSECDDGLFCNGIETCDPILDCQAGTPIDCDDGVACTDDTCNEATDSCDNIPNNSPCSDGLFCNGIETCHPLTGCQDGTPPACDDGIGCTNDDCDELIDSCVFVPDDSLCGDTIFCDGAEVCHPSLGCERGTDPCPNQLCDEAADVCAPCQLDLDCDDGIACNGAEICIGGTCRGDDPECSTIEEFEAGTGGWTVSGDCATGAFVLGTPDLVMTNGITTQVGGDHTTGSGQAFFTAPNAGGVGTDDVDGGECIVTSPMYQLSEDSDISIWYYHGQRDAGDDPTGDYFELEISIDGGAWTHFVPSGGEASFGDVRVDAAWTLATTQALAGETVRIRVRVSDGSGPGDIIEAGLDDLAICPSL